MKEVLVVIPVTEAHKARLEAIGKDCAFVYCPEKEVTEELVQDASVIIGCVPAKMIRASEKLELLQLHSAGADPYIVPGVLAEKTILCNATGAYGRTVSEHAFALTLMLLKKLHLYRSAQERREWTDFGTVSSLSNATVVIAGLGDIGVCYARMAKALGATVIGVKRRAGKCPDCVDELVLTEELDKVLPRADVVVSFLPNTKQTVHIFHAERLKLMKRSAVLINCGRGNAIDPEALLDALRGGTIAACAVDVTEPEPLPADSPLWQEPNMVITPHVAGLFHLPYTLERIVDIACENLEKYLAGDLPLRNEVDFETGYKK